MGRKNQSLRKRLLGGMAMASIGVALGATPAVAQLPPIYSRCANATGNLDDSIAACTALIQSGREHGRSLAISYYNRGIGWMRKGDVDRAITDLTQAIRVDPGYAKAYNARGAAFGKKHEPDRAFADFDRAIELDPSLAPAYSNRGSAFADKGELDRAIADANAAIRINPNYARAYAVRGRAYAQKGEPDRALPDLDQAIGLDARFAPAYNARGLVYRNRGDKGRALSDFDEAIRLDPSLGAAYNNRALLRRDQRDFVGALVDLDQAIRINPRYVLAYVNRGRLHEESGDRGKALADFNAALAIDPRHAEAQAGRSRMSMLQPAPGPSRRPAAAPAPAQLPKPLSPNVGAWTQQRPPAAETHQTVATPAKPAITAVPQQQAPAARTIGAAPAAIPAAPPARSFTEALAACIRAAEGASSVVIAGPGGNGKITIPSCYKGRRHLDCTMGALLEEASAIDREYGEIVRENYPDRKDVKAICGIPANRLEEHLNCSKTFDSRATKVQQVFQANATCIESVRVAIGDINLGHMRDPGGLMSSLLQEVGRPVAQAAERQRDVMRLVGQIEESRQAIDTVRELRQLVCP
jgi:tetratricopeptide (TPR) repeat protein